MIIVVLLLAVPVTLFIIWMKAVKWAFKENEKNNKKVTAKGIMYANQAREILCRKK